MCACSSGSAASAVPSLLTLVIALVAGRLWDPADDHSGEGWSGVRAAFCPPGHGTKFICYVCGHLPTILSATTASPSADLYWGTNCYLLGGWAMLFCIACFVEAFTRLHENVCNTARDSKELSEDVFSLVEYGEVTCESGDTENARTFIIPTRICSYGKSSLITNIVI